MPKITFIEAEGRELTVDAPVGLSILDIAEQNKIALEGACDGALACATCHIVVDPDWYNKLPPAREEEEDILDLVFGLTPTSRLGCQLMMTEELDGLVIKIPPSSRNIR